MTNAISPLVRSSKLSIVAALGFDPVWFGVLFCLNVQIAYLSPSDGPVAFCIIATIKSSEGVRYRYPATLRLVS